MGLVGLVGLMDLLSFDGLSGLMRLLVVVGLVCQVWLILDNFVLFSMIQRYFQLNKAIDIPKDFNDPQGSVGLKLISIKV